MTVEKITAYAKELRDLKHLKDRHGEATKKINKRIDELTSHLLPEEMENNDITKISVDDVGTVSLRGEVYASIAAADREEAYQWLRDTGRGSLVVETVNASTLKAAAKEWIKQGEEIPDVIKVTPITVAVLTASKK